MTFPRHPRIDSDPQVCHGTPVIAGTRLPISQIVGALSTGETKASLLESYPTLRLEDIDAALAFAGELAAFELLATAG